MPAPYWPPRAVREPPPEMVTASPVDRNTPAPSSAAAKKLVPSIASVTLRFESSLKGLGPYGEFVRSMVTSVTVTAQSASASTQKLVLVPAMA